VIFYEGWRENGFASFFFSSNVIAIIMKFAWMIHSFFAIMRLFLYRVFVIFNILLQTVSKMLYTNVVKFPASASEHIT
jgi:hypothetical protein